MRLVCVPDFQFTLKDIKKLVTRVYVRPDLNVFLQRNKLCVVGVQLPIGNHVSQALEVVGWVVDASLGQTNALFLPMNTEKGVRLGLKQVGKVFAENHRYPRPTAQS